MFLLLACAEPAPEAAPSFWLGINLPWVEYGIDVHTTAWGDYTFEADSTALELALDAVADSGARSTRWWLFGDGRAAPAFVDGRPQPVDDEVITNVTTLLDAAAARELTVVPVVLDFGWCAAPEVVSGVTLGGHADVFGTEAGRAALTASVVSLADAVGDHPALAGWDLFNEPEWAFNGDLYDLGDSCATDGVRAWVDATAEALAPAKITVGSASYAWMDQHWADATPGVLQFHNYWEPLDTLDGGRNRPVILGEFPTADADLTLALDTAWERGFSGAAPWSLLAEDDATDLDTTELATWAADHAVTGALP